MHARPGHSHDGRHRAVRQYPKAAWLQGGRRSGRAGLHPAGAAHADAGSPGKWLLAGAADVGAGRWAAWAGQRHTYIPAEEPTGAAAPGNGSAQRSNSLRRPTAQGGPIRGRPGQPRGVGRREERGATWLPAGCAFRPDGKERFALHAWPSRSWPSATWLSVRKLSSEVQYQPTRCKVSHKAFERPHAVIASTDRRKCLCRDALVLPVAPKAQPVSSR